MGSTRLPGKVVADVCGRPIVSHIADRLGHARRLARVAIATADGADCHPVREVASRDGISCFSGAEDDLIDRMYRAALHYTADAVVRVTADCPFVDPGLVDRLVDWYLQRRAEVDVVLNWRPRTFPHGLDLEVYAVRVLERLWREIRAPHDREWFPTYVVSRPDAFRIENVANDRDLSPLRWTVDYPEDLAFCRAVYERLWRAGKVFGMEEILALLAREPALAALNLMHASPAGAHESGAKR